VTRFTQPHIHMYMHVLSLCCLYPLYHLLGRITNENFQKITFLMQFFTHNFTPKRYELRYHCCFSQATVFHRALASCCSRKIE
jgi:hypothetical protein